MKEIGEKGSPEWGIQEFNKLYTVEADYKFMRADESYVSIRYEYYRNLGGAYPVMSLWGSTYQAETSACIRNSVRRDF